MIPNENSLRRKGRELKLSVKITLTFYTKAEARNIHFCFIYRNVVNIKCEYYWKGFSVTFFPSNTRSRKFDMQKNLGLVKEKVLELTNNGKGKCNSICPLVGLKSHC
jgi:hypothetical protein